MAEETESDWTLTEHDKTFLLPGESSIDHRTMRRRIRQYYHQTWQQAKYYPDIQAGQAALREARRMLEEQGSYNSEIAAKESDHT